MACSSGAESEQENFEQAAAVDAADAHLVIHLKFFGIDEHPKQIA